MTVIACRHIRLVPREYEEAFRELGWQTSCGPSTAPWAIMAVWECADDQRPPEPDLGEWDRMWLKRFHRPELIEGNGG